MGCFMVLRKPSFCCHLANKVLGQNSVAIRCRSNSRAKIAKYFDAIDSSLKVWYF